MLNYKAVGFILNLRVLTVEYNSKVFLFVIDRGSMQNEIRYRIERAQFTTSSDLLYTYPRDFPTRQELPFLRPPKLGNTREELLIESKTLIVNTKLREFRTGFR